MKISKWNKNLTEQEHRERKRFASQARKAFLKKACETCAIEKRLEIHHIDRDWRNNSEKNLMTLCSVCHMKWHHERGLIFPNERRAKPCKVEGCKTISRRRGFCEKHFERMDRHGTTDPRKKQDSPCVVCGTPYVPLKSRGNLCNIHRKVKQRYGDPFAKQVGRGHKIPH